MLSQSTLSAIQSSQTIKRSIYTLPLKSLKHIHAQDATYLKNKEHLFNPEYLNLAQNVQKTNKPETLLIPLVVSVSHEEMLQGFPAHVRLFKGNLDFASRIVRSLETQNLDYLGEKFVSKTQKIDNDIEFVVKNAEYNKFPEFKILSMNIPVGTPLAYDDHNNPFLLEGTFIKMKKPKVQDTYSIIYHGEVINHKSYHTLD